MMPLPEEKRKVCYLQTEGAEDPLPVDQGHLSGVDPFTQPSKTRTQSQSAHCDPAALVSIIQMSDVISLF